jgi:hypothetical protein
MTAFRGLMVLGGLALLTIVVVSFVKGDSVAPDDAPGSDAQLLHSHHDGARHLAEQRLGDREGRLSRHSALDVRASSHAPPAKAVRMPAPTSPEGSPDGSRGKDSVEYSPLE